MQLRSPKGLRRLLAVGGSVIATVLGAPSVASAAIFYVDDVPHVPGACTSPPPADPCSTITEAIGQARGGGFPGGDTIMVRGRELPRGGGFRRSAGCR